MRPDELERELQARLDAFPPAARAELLHVLCSPTWSGPSGLAVLLDPKTRTFAGSSFIDSGSWHPAASAEGDRHIFEHRSSPSLPLLALAKGEALRLYSTDPVLCLGIGNLVTDPGA